MKLLRNNAILCNGKYKIERVLGQGGFGITYLAKQKVSVAGALGTIDAEIEVTIKEFFMKELCNRDEASSMVTVPSTGSAELVEKFRQKFIKEAKNISKLTHPHIIKVLDVFEENGTAYYVMEYIDGGSLSDLIEKNGSLSEDETLKYTRQIASALQYIHAHNMNHLDVKPGNVLLRQNGDVVLIDFGMSKNYDVAGEQTTSSPVGVSVGYAPIEQSRVGGLGMFSPETDIYSLGATMFKMLTGQTPPEATAVFDEGLPELPMEISEQTKRVIKKAMQPRRKERYHSIEEFVKMLHMEQPYISSVRLEEKVEIDSEETLLKSSVEKLGPYFRNENKQQTKKTPSDDSLYVNTPKRKNSTKKQSDKWNELYKDFLNHFLRKCRYFTFPLGLFFGASMGLCCSESSSLFDTIMATAFFGIVWGLFIGFMLPRFLYWFTKGYFVKQRLQKVIAEEYSWLQDYHQSQIEQQKTKKWNNWVLNCLYFIWPIMLFLSNIFLQSISNGTFWKDSVVISIWGLLVISFVVAWIVSMIFAVILKLIRL